MLPISLTDIYSRKRSRGLRPTAGRLVIGMAFSSTKAKYRSTHIFLSGSGPNSYRRVIFSLVVVEELDFYI